MQHIDLKERIIIWVAFDFPDLPYPDFGLLNILREWKDGTSLLRRTSYQSGAPWCTEPPLGSLPRATALYSMPVTSRRENITPHTYQWLPTQVSQTSAWVLSHKNVAAEMLLVPIYTSVSELAVVSNALLIMLRHKTCSFISVNNRLWPACVAWHKADYFCTKEKNRRGSVP